MKSPKQSLRAIDPQTLIDNIERRVKGLFQNEGTGHDWHHIDRVRRTALSLAAVEGGDTILVQAAALLHDIADHKFHDGDLSLGPQRAAEVVRECGGDEDFAERVAQIVSETSFQGAGVDTPVSSMESAVVQDADRLDALGPIGIGRAFAYGGSKGRSLFDPDTPPVIHGGFSAYASSTSPTVNHFYEKLFLLKDRMQTDTGKRRAEALHTYMEGFLDLFYKQWRGEV